MFDVEPEPSSLLAVWPPSLEAPDVTSFLNALETSSHLRFASIQNRPPRSTQMRWEILADVITKDTEPLQINIALVPMPELGLHFPVLGLTVEQPARWGILAETTFRKGRILDDFHLQLQVLAIVTPKRVSVMDCSAFVPRAPGWLHAMAEVEVPPSPRYLHSIQAVSSKGVAWLHTHGLQRCRCIELEAFDVPVDHAASVATLINSVAGSFIENGVPAPGTTFSHGGMVELQWLPYKKASAKLPRPAAGGAEDRNQDHNLERGVLVVPKSARLFGLLPGGVENVAKSTEALDMPFEPVTSLETVRRRLLAHARWGAFVNLFTENQGRPGWAFTVKLGFRCDDPNSPIESEHLWFNVHGLLENEIDATLDSSPNYVSHLKSGQRGRYPLDLLSEWSIFCEQGKIDADNVWMFTAEKP